MKRRISCLIVLSLVLLMTGCGESSSSGNAQQAEIEEPKIEEARQDYDLPIGKGVQKNASQDCLAVMNTNKELYRSYAVEDPAAVAFARKDLVKMQRNISKTGYPVTTTSNWTNMANYDQVEEFLQKVKQGKKDQVIIYQINLDGGVTRNVFSFGGKKMYLFQTTACWNSQGRAVVVSMNKSKVESFQYTKKGWFVYELCVPQEPDVTEVVDGSYMIRVKPLPEENRVLAYRYLEPIGYMGNNLFLIDWDEGNLKKLDYNALYQYFYGIKNQVDSQQKQYTKGIGREKFENLMTEFLPVTKQQVRSLAVFNESTGKYGWKNLGCGTYVPAGFGMSVPEITKVVEKENHIYVLTVDAVCESVGDDAIMTHQVILQVTDSGKVKYLGNQILSGGDQIPDYQYRVTEE